MEGDGGAEEEEEEDEEEEEEEEKEEEEGEGRKRKEVLLKGLSKQRVHRDSSGGGIQLHKPEVRYCY